MTKDDVVAFLSISNSGQTDELLRFIPAGAAHANPHHRRAAILIRSLPKYSTAHINVRVERKPARSTSP